MLLSFLAFSQMSQDKVYNITSENGLLSDNVECIYQDSYGFLWIGSSEGLVRWDGYSYKKYTHIEGNAGTISNNIIYCIFEDYKRRLWIGTINGLNLYNPALDTFSKIIINTEVENIPVNVIKEDSKHRLWLATSDGLCHYDHNNKKSTLIFSDVDNPDGLSDAILFSMAIDNKDNIWVGTFNGGLNCYNPTTKKFKRFTHDPKSTNSICSNKINKLLIDRNGDIWAGSVDNGVSLLNKEGQLIKHYSPSYFPSKSNATQSSISCIYQDKQQRIWIGLSDRELFILDENRTSFKTFSNPVYKKYHLKCQGITAMYEDSFGNTWFGSERRGLFYSNQTKNLFKHYFHNYASTKGLSNNTVSSFCQDKKGNTWIGTNGGGLDYLDIQTNTIIPFSSKIKLNNLSVQAIKQDASSKLWIGTRGGGLTYTDPISGQTSVFRNNPSNSNSLIFDDVTSIVIDDSLIWLGTYGEGICIYNTVTKKFIHHKNNTLYNFNMLTPAWTNYIFKDSKNRVWMGAYGGLYCYEKNNFHTYQHSKDANSISNHDINMIAEDKEGRIWIVTVAGGLELFNEKDKSFIHYSKKYNLPYTLKSITVDAEGLLWMGSNEGLICFNPTSKQQIRYGKSDGLQGDFFTLRAASVNRNGELFFGGNNGFNTFSPKSIQTQLKNKAFYFTDLSVHGILQNPSDEKSALKKNLLISDTLHISHHQSFFTIGFTDINFYAPEKTFYAYKLQGLYDKWIDNGNERKVSFTNLPAGKYTLLVKYTLPNGQWIEANKKLHIIVSPPWWNSFRFRIVAIIFIVVGIIMLFKIRLRRIKQRNEELEYEVKNRTQELSDKNNELHESNEEIRQQRDQLEEYNTEVIRQSDKILNQQEYILSQNKELEQLVEQLSSSDETKNLFFNILAHDLKGPINAIGSLSDLLLNNITNFSQAEIIDFCTHIQKSSSATRQLLFNLLDWARTQSHYLDYTPTGINVSDMVSKNTLLLEQQILQKKIIINADIDKTHTVFADANMLDTVIRNLLSNAIKFTPEEGGITINSKVHEEEIEIIISDNGVGMSGTEMTEIFRLDKKLSKPGTKGEKGTGLGLIIVKEFIEINKGRIAVTSEIKTGTTFTLHFPKSVENIVASTTFETPQILQIEDSIEVTFNEEQLHEVKGNRILLVEDNQAMRMHLKHLLSSTFEIVEAGNGEEGLVVAAENQPMVIITDMAMPIMDGLELTKSIKQNPNTSHIPVIILTSHDTEESKLSGYYAGADIYLTKPVKKEIIFQVIFNILQSRELLRQKLLSNSTNKDTTTIELNTIDQVFLEDINMFIETHLRDQQFEVQHIVKHMGMSRSVLYSKFKAITGQGVNEFIRLVRLRKSMALLTNSSLSINEVADEVGFNSASYFIRCFSNEYHCTPLEFREKKHNNVRL